MYWVIAADTDEQGDLMGLQYERDHRGRDWMSGSPFVTSADAPVFHQPPPEPIEVRIKAGREKAPWPSFLEEPIPLMSAALLDTVRADGVDNIQAYRISLLYAEGKPASDDYYAFNLVGAIAAADLEGSKFDPEQEDRVVAMSFDSLKIDEEKTHSALMFRLAENITTILVHDRVKTAIEDAEIPLVRFFKPGEIAIL